MTIVWLALIFVGVTLTTYAWLMLRKLEAERRDSQR